MYSHKLLYEYEPINHTKKYLFFQFNFFFVFSYWILNYFHALVIFKNDIRISAGHAKYDNLARPQHCKTPTFQDPSPTAGVTEDTTPTAGATHCKTLQPMAGATQDFIPRQKQHKTPAHGRSNTRPKPHSRSNTRPQPHGRSNTRPQPKAGATQDPSPRQE